jgi:hypothetical protein
MYRMLLIYFDDYVHAPFMQLHRQAPDHASWQLHVNINRVRGNLNDLHSVCESVNQIVANLDHEYARGMHILHRLTTNTTIRAPVIERGMPSIQESEEAAETYDHAASAFSRVDELDEFFDVSDAASLHSRQSSVLETKRYGLKQGAVSPPAAKSTSSRSTADVPRVFTGSFEELEKSVRKLRLHESTVKQEPVKVKDFAMPTPCLLPSPATLLERREAIIAREAEWDQRILAGRSVRSRRPSDKHRALTVNDRSGSLEAWLATPSPERATRTLQRQHTL